MPSPPPPPGPPLVTVMGVSGSGKTTVGAALAQRLGVPFADADDFHPEANVAKMSAGVPLDDIDRLPWLHILGNWQAAYAATGAVVTCSAMRRWYRDVLREAAPGQVFIHLDWPPEVVARRAERAEPGEERRSWTSPTYALKASSARSAGADTPDWRKIRST